MLRKLSVFDAYAKANEGIQVKTTFGAIVTVVSVILMVILSLSEFSLFMTSQTEHHLQIDQTRSEAVHVELDIAFYAARCSMLNVHIGDTRGHTYPQAHVNVRKHPFVPPVLMAENPQTKWTPDNTPGCIVKGTLTLRKMAGMIAIQAMTPHNLARFGATRYPATNFSHEIRRFSLGPMVSGGSVNPLNHVKKGFDGVAEFQYFLKVVPTVVDKMFGQVETNQYSVTEFTSVPNEDNMNVRPQLLFKLEFSPIMIRVGQRGKSFAQFLTGLCAIVGGVFTVAGMLDSTVYQSSKVLMGKSE